MFLTNRSEDKENFFLVSPMVRMLRLRSVSGEGVIEGRRERVERDTASRI